MGKCSLFALCLPMRHLHDDSLCKYRYYCQKYWPNRGVPTPFSACLAKRANAGFIRSMVPNCSSSMQQRFVWTLNSISISRRAWYQSISSFSEAASVATRLGGAAVVACRRGFQVRQMLAADLCKRRCAIGRISETAGRAASLNINKACPILRFTQASRACAAVQKSRAVQAQTISACTALHPTLSTPFPRNQITSAAD